MLNKNQYSLTPPDQTKGKTLELYPFVGLLICVGVVGFVGIILETVVTHSVSSFDRSILLALRDPSDPAKALGPQWLQIAARDVTSLGSPAVLTLFTLAAAGFLILRRFYGEAVLLVSAIITGTLVSNGLKAWAERPRPDFVAEIAQTQTYSFPSGHAFLSAVTFLSIGALLARSQPQARIKTYIITVAITLSIIVGLSRVYLGVHWPTDVLAGWFAGALWAVLCWAFEAWLQRRNVLPPTP